MDSNNKIDVILQQEIEKNKYLRGHLSRIKESYNFIEKYLSDGQKIIDLGSYGHFTKILSNFYESQYDLSNFDLRYNFPLEDSKYDMVLCMEVIEHIKDRDSNNLEFISSFRYTGILNLLCEINRILKNDGILFLTTPNLNNYLSILKILKHESPYFFNPHPRELSINEVKRLLTKTGFSILEIDTKDVWNDYSVSSDKYTDFINQIKKFCEENEFSQNLRGDDIFIIAKKIKNPEEILLDTEYFKVTTGDIYNQ